MNRNQKRDRVEQRLASWRAAAQEAGVKLTHQRLEVFRELAGSETHPDAEAVFRGVRERVPTVSLDTVYRTLWLLHDLGLVATLSPRSAGIRFDANAERHHHFVCVRCGLVRDVESRELDAVTIPEDLHELGEVLEARVEVRGICASCERDRAIEERDEHRGTTNGRRNEP